MQLIKQGTLALALVLGLSACEDATGPSQGQGRMQFDAAGDASESSASRGSEDAPAFSRSFSAEGEAQGTIDFRARVYVRSELGEWTEITSRTAQQATVDAGASGRTTSFASANVGAGSYTQVRVVFEEVKANITGGLQVGVGELLQGTVTVDFGGQEKVEVVQAVDVEVEANAETHLLIDLNADAWLSQANAESKAVGATEFTSAVRITSQ